MQPDGETSMKIHCIGFLAFTLTGVAALCAANAAEMSKAPQPAAGGEKDVPFFTSWTGFYAGINGGGGWDANSRRGITIFTEPALEGYPATTRGTDANGGFGG